MLATVTIGYIGFRPLLLGLALANQEPLTVFVTDSAPALYAYCDHAISKAKRCFSLPEGGEVFALNPEAAGKRHQTNGYRGNRTTHIYTMPLGLGVIIPPRWRTIAPG